MTISTFKGDYDFLSNFYPVQVVLDNHAYPSVEHAFQAAKTEDPVIREQIRLLPTAAKAKQAGRRVRIRSDWETAKIGVMRDLLKEKFSHQDLKEKLLATDGALLVEGNWWHDNFWGVCTCSKCPPGLNHLGRLLMEIRTNLREG